ncbi:MAG: response regulator [Peptococcaceae bacterium]|nr:response regulator [Peptococcaceae bacterium]
MNQRTIILVVDDSPTTLQLCQGLLSDEFDVRLAKSGAMALTALSRMYPDVILLDIEMPDMSGFEVMERISRTPDLKGTPVIFLTSHATTDLVAKAAEYGAVDYVAKPFDTENLRTKIHNALNS